MEIIPIKTRLLQPPKDDLFRILDEHLSELLNGDIVVVTSKVVAIHQGRCVPMEECADKEELVKGEADHYWEVSGGFKLRLTIKYHTFVSASGIDESNGKGYYMLLPSDPFGAARDVWEYLKSKHGVDELGVIVTDSYSLPFRFGAMSISIGYWGFFPLRHYEGKKDLFGRRFVYERNNMVDAIAAASTIEMGEGDESIPIAIARNVKDLEFTSTDTRDEFLIPPEEDIYYPLFRSFFENNK